jgi:hypothetical protein
MATHNPNVGKEGLGSPLEAEASAPVDKAGDASLDMTLNPLHNSDLDLPEGLSDLVRAAGAILRDWAYKNGNGYTDGCPPSSLRKPWQNTRNPTGTVPSLSFSMTEDL